MLTRVSKRASDPPGQLWTPRPKARCSRAFSRATRNSPSSRAESSTWRWRARWTDSLCERAVSRTSHGRLLGQHQMIQDYIARSHMEIQAARLLTFQTAWRIDQVGAAAVRAELGMIKAHVSEVVLAVLDRTIQVCGGIWPKPVVSVR